MFQRANVAVKTIDLLTGKPLQGVRVDLGTPTYSLDGVTDSKGQMIFTVDVGGGEAGRHPEPGLAVRLAVSKSGYVPQSERFLLYGNQAFIYRMERM